MAPAGSSSTDWHAECDTGGMSNARQSPIPQDRVNENIDQAHRADVGRRELAEQERYLKDQGVDERPGTNPKEQPGLPDEAASPADGGD